MSNPAETWPSHQKGDLEDDYAAKPSSGTPNSSKLTGKRKTHFQLNAATPPTPSTLNQSEDDQEDPTTTDGEEIDVVEDTKRDAGNREPPRKLPSGIAIAMISPSQAQEITPSMIFERSKEPVEGEVLKNRLRMAERLDRK